MFEKKLDGVIEAVHYTADGQVDWVRAYERRGPTYSDCILLDRATLVQRLKERKHFMVGRRLPLQASTFDTSVPVRLLRMKDREVLVTGYVHSEHDRLEGVPVI